MPDADEDIVTPAALTERDKVERWRLETLLDAGFSIEDAESVAAADVDLHVAVALVEAGCKPETAAAILL